MTRSEFLKKYSGEEKKTAEKKRGASSREAFLKKYGTKTYSSGEEYVKDVISKTPSVSNALSTEAARAEKMWQKHPEQYAAAREHAEKLLDPQYAAAYEQTKAEYDAWWGKITTDVSALEKKKASLDASKGQSWDKQSVVMQQYNADIDKQIADLEKQIVDAKTAQYAYKYSLIPKRSDYAQYAYDESKKGTELYDAVFLQLSSPDMLNPTHRAEYDAILNSDSETAAKDAEDYLMLHLGNTETAILSNMEYVTDTEMNTFRYILNKEGEQAARDYIGFIQGDINARKAIAEIDEKKKHPFWNTFAAGVDSALPDIFESLRNPVTGARPVKANEITSGMIREDAKGIKGLALDVTGAVGGMVPSLALSAINPYAGIAALGASVYDNNTQAALREGKSKSDAIAYGISSAVLEMVSERVLGGIGALSDHRLAKTLLSKTDDVLAKLKPFTAKLARMGVGTVANMGSEAFEEWLVSTLDPALRNSIFGEQNAVKLVTADSMYDALTGAVTALFLGGSTNFGTANYQETINRLVHNTQSFTDPEVVKMREDFADRIHDAKNPVTQAERNAFVEKCAAEVIAKTEKTVELQTTDAVQTVATGTQAPQSQSQTVRESLSRSAQQLLDDVLTIDEIENKDAAANAFEMYYLSGYLGKEFEADTDAEAAFSTAIQRAAFDAGVKARQSLGTVTVEKGTKVSDGLVALAGKVAQELHTHVTIGGKAPVENGIQTRGYSTKYGELHIYADAKVKMADGTTLYGEDAARVIILGHELTHRLEQLAPKEYAEVEKLALRARADEIGVKAYQNTGGYSEKSAKNEITADYAMEKLFTDEKTIGVVTKQHSKLAEVIRGILQWIKEKIGKSNEIDRAIYLWNKAYNQASRNAKNSDVHDAVAQGEWITKKSEQHFENSIVPYSDFRLQMILSDSNNVVATSIADVQSFVKEALEQTQLKKRLHLGAITGDLFERILSDAPNLPKDKKDTLFRKDREYSLVVGQDDVRHLFEDKSSMTEQDAVEYICNLPQIVNAYDSVHYTEEQYGKTNLRGFLFKKQFADGQYASVEIISKKKSELQMRTTYMVSSDYKKKKATTNTVLMQNAASITSETPAGSSPSVNSIDDVEKKVKGNGTKNSTSATDELGEVLEEIAKEEEREVKSVARELVRREQGAKADGRRYTMSLDTFEQVANSYAADIADEIARKKFVKKLFDATVPLAAAHRSHGDAKAAFYDKAWRGMKSAARVLEADEAAVGDLAEEMLTILLESGYEGAASSRTAREMFMSTRQEAMDEALSNGKKVSLSEVVLRRENFKKSERIAEILKKNKDLREQADEIRVRGSIRKEYQERYSKLKEEYHENDTVQKQRNRIEKNAAALYKWAVKPDKKWHSIPEAARGPILEMLGRLNMMKSGEGMEPSLHDIQWHERLFDIANALYDRKTLDTQKENGNLPDTVDGYIPIAQIERIHAAADAIGKANVYEMRGAELRALDEALCILRKMVIDANEMHLEGRTVELETAAEAEMKRLDGTSKSKTWKITYDMMDSLTFSEHIGGLFGKLVKKLRERFDVFIRATADVQAFVQDTVTDKEVREWRANVKAVKFGARKVYMTDTQLMSLYLLSKRPQAEKHIYGGGIRIDHKAIQDGGDADAVAWAKETKEQSFGAITKEDVQEAITLLTPRQREVADKIQRFMADVLGGMGNEVTMQLYGFFGFTEANYFPIKTVKEANKTTIATDNVDNVFSVLTASMTKNTTEFAKNPIAIEDMFSVFVKHASDMVNYYAYAEAVSDCMRVYNYKLESRDNTLAELLQATYKGANDFFKDQIRALNSQKAFGITEFDSVLRKMSGNAKAAMVGLNLRVVLQQPSSILRAMAIMDRKYFTPRKTVKKVSQEKIFRYCPIAQWKSWGFYDTEIAPSMDALLFGTRNRYEEAKDKQMWLAGKADEVAWAMLWNACEAEIKDKRRELKVGSEEFNQAVGARLSEVIDATQVVDSPFHRVQAMRSKGDFAKTALSFQSESMKNLNLLYRSSKQGKKPAFRAFLAIEAAGIAAAVGAGILDALRDDDEEKNLWEKYLSNTAENIVGNVNPLSWVPFAADAANAGGKILFAVVDKMLGTNLADRIPRVFDQSRYDTMLLTEFVDLAETLASDNNAWYDDLYALLKFADMGTGIGTANAFRDIMGFIVNIANGVPPKGAYKKSLSSGNTQKVRENYNAFRDAKCEEIAKDKYGVEFKKLSRTEREKIRASAESSIRTTTKSLFKEHYIKAWKKGDGEAITRIRATLLATDLYDMDGIKDLFASFVKSYYREQYKEAKNEKDKQAVIKEAAKAKGRLIGDFRIFNSYAEANKYFTS